MSTEMKVQALFITTPFGIVKAEIDKDLGKFTHLRESSYSTFFTLYYDVKDRRSLWKRFLMLFKGKKLHYKDEQIKIHVAGSANTDEGTTKVEASIVGGRRIYKTVGYDLSVVRVNNNQRSLSERGQILEVETQGNIRKTTVSDHPTRKKYANKSQAPKNKGPAPRKGRFPSPRY